VDEFKCRLLPPNHCSCNAADALTRERSGARATLICRAAVTGECKESVHTCTYAHLKPEDMKAMALDDCASCGEPLKVFASLSFTPSRNYTLCLHTGSL
jgi:hypothetical protein